MQLFLWRHADASAGTPDKERPLSAEGLKQAALTAKWLNSILPVNSLILVSPAKRTCQTADALGRSYTIHDSVALGSTPEAILSATGWPDGEKTVLVVGHQPLLGYLASLLLGGKQQQWHVEKSNVWWFEGQGINHLETKLKAVISPSLLTTGGQIQLSEENNKNNRVS
ncbi:MAG: histidine phosphatase family protein [Betaproteobacteria bacterium]|nr:histidine phosphatase family protein [Betaproteobacteria bacterium]